MATKKPPESIFRKAFPSLEDLLGFLRDCECCEVKYHLIKRPKKGGGVRIIYSPSEKLKIVQEEILSIISHWYVDVCQFGFIKRKSCRDNTRYHIHEYEAKTRRWKKMLVKAVPVWMVKIDIKDAFPSVKSKHLRILFKDIFSPLLKNAFSEISLKENEKIYNNLVNQFTRLTTYRRKLPQGAPCSPYLFNLVLSRGGIIEKIKKKCGERAKKRRKGCQITPFKPSVYADDIVITSLKDRISNRFIREIIEIIESDGIFKINPDKIRRSSLKYKAHKITGIVLDDRWINGVVGHITLPQKVRGTYRGKLHRATAILLTGRLPSKEKDGLSIEQALGIIARIRDVFQKQFLPSDLKLIVHNFEETWKEFRREIL